MHSYMYVLFVYIFVSYRQYNAISGELPLFEFFFWKEEFSFDSDDIVVW